MKCLDTYALVEIALANEKFSSLLTDEILITDITMAEFYYVILQKYNQPTADYWYKRLSHYCSQVPIRILVKAVIFRHENKKKKLSFFDCVGYIFSQENKHTFVTGDKEFEKLDGVLFISK